MQFVSFYMRSDVDGRKQIVLDDLVIEDSGDGGGSILHPIP